ncbi:DinB family protein [Flavobacteriaceae bacterium S356]|uniref:DinB family protein n=1 Tax=Asprobacillus argus TaxID=3076534 RepID=A0ABU3LEE9_9FLAO|nr:DinB family protein [Flavobacteriaceae bacterium S356]
MEKKEIIAVLEKKHTDLFDWVANHSSEKWEMGPEGKWTSGQHILHLAESIRLLNKALRTPKFLLKRKFGVANRPVRSYNEVAKRYEERLTANLEKSRDFNKNLNKPSLKQKQRLLASLQIQNKKLQYKTNKWSDHNLDTVLLPHPLMGRMIIREIIMWTAHHTEHHTTILKEHY